MVPQELMGIQVHARTGIYTSNTPNDRLRSTLISHRRKADAESKRLDCEDKQIASHNAKIDQAKIKVAKAHEKLNSLQSASSAPAAIERAKRSLENAQRLLTKATEKGNDLTQTFWLYKFPRKHFFAFLKDPVLCENWRIPRGAFRVSNSPLSVIVPPTLFFNVADEPDSSALPHASRLALATSSTIDIRLVLPVPIAMLPWPLCELAGELARRSFFVVVDWAEGVADGVNDIVCARVTAARGSCVVWDPLGALVALLIDEFRDKDVEVELILVFLIVLEVEVDVDKLPVGRTSVVVEADFEKDEAGNEEGSDLRLSDLLLFTLLFFVYSSLLHSHHDSDPYPPPSLPPAAAPQPTLPLST
ncbi:hypothetical protein EV360DRAFT_87773 [Lentinula raphanica]|nr:hypothetical protein EV360DRAFT_87773 [Lentinula raphanica]